MLQEYFSLILYSVFTKIQECHLFMEDFASESNIHRFVLKIICTVLRDKVVTTFYFVAENTPTHTQSSKSFKCYPEAPETMKHLSKRTGKISPV